MLSKKQIWLVIIIILIIVFLLSLLYSKNREISFLESKNNELQLRIDACREDNANSIIEKELLYTNLEELNTTLSSQTKLIISLTKQIKQYPNNKDILYFE